MRLKEISILLIGVFGGFFLSKNLNHPTTKSVNEINEALGNMLYEDLQKFPSEWEFDQIAQTMHGLVNGNRAPLEKNVKDKLLLELASTKAERISSENLKAAENFLTKLSLNKQIQPVVDGKVYIEILKQGSGEKALTFNDKASVSFKQFDIKGELIKDTQTKSFIIPISRMIKGFQLGMKGAKVGEVRKIYIHPEYGFGKIGRSQESNMLLIYEISVEEIIPEDRF